jgi:hypothetical protein
MTMKTTRDDVLFGALLKMEQYRKERAYWSTDPRTRKTKEWKGNSHVNF